MDLWIENATLIPMTERGRVIRGGTVRIQAGTISEITTTRIAKNEAKGKVIDGRGMIVLPGLINAHVHLFQTLIRGQFDNLPLLDWLKGIYATGKALTAKDCYHAALLGCLESIRSGTTTLVDHHFLYNDPESADAILTAFKEIKIRGFLARGMMDEGELVAPEARQTHEAIFNHCDDLLSRYSKEIKEKKIGILVGPNTPGINCSPGLIRKAKEFAKERGIRISTHIAENDGIIRQVRGKYGCGGVVEFLHSLDFLGEEVLGAHCVRVSPLEIKILGETKTKVAHNPVSNMFLADGVAPVAQMLREGITISLGTDSTAANNSQDMFEVMKATTLLQRVSALDASLLPPWEVLELATVHGARALGLEDEIGTLEPGKRADLIGIDFSSSPHAIAMHSEVSQIVHCARPSDVKLVVIGGEIVMEGGVIQGSKEQDILRQGQETGEDLINRIT
ncbi:MAG TPA: amidohydrolase [Thermodesulfobacteriota bacterium]|nr:amidohydrolase [Thermodesulfobacteriota bacterium]